MGKVKVDAEALIAMQKQLQNQLDKYLLTMNGIFALQNRLADSWDEKQAGSFRDFIEDIKSSNHDIESCVKEIKTKIGQMIQLAEEYKRYTF